MKPKKVNISVNPETMAVLTKIRERLAIELGFTPSYSQVIQHLANEQNHESMDMFTNGETK